MNISVISDGGWGTAMAQHLVGLEHQVTIWGAFEDNIAAMQADGENRRFLAGVKLDPRLKYTTDIDYAVESAEIIVLATPSQFLRNSLELLKGRVKQGQIFVDLAKGIEVTTGKCMHEVVEEILGEVRYVVLSGPSHAEEVARNIPTAVMAASTDVDAAKTVQQEFSGGCLRVYTSADVIGAELGGALKNVFAIAAGITDGMGLGDNSKAALITRGIVEMARLGEALGGEAATFAGLSGIGDLIVTCTSGHSRNRFVGEELGKGKTLDEIKEQMGRVVAEGIRTTESAYALAQARGIDTPIVNEVYACLYQGKSPKLAINQLMNRPLKVED
jgi:glycerol-3-phosphate dehydrogenase (NAD(P)+)